MPEPAALDRARAIVQHAKYCGAPLKQFSVTVSKAEGFELLGWFRENADPETIDLTLLDEAIAECRRRDDPFEVLREFKLAGVDIIPQPN